MTFHIIIDNEPDTSSKQLAALAALDADKMHQLFPNTVGKTPYEVWLEIVTELNAIDAKYNKTETITPDGDLVIAYPTEEDHTASDAEQSAAVSALPTVSEPVLNPDGTQKLNAHGHPAVAEFNVWQWITGQITS